MCTESNIEYKAFHLEDGYLSLKEMLEATEKYIVEREIDKYEVSVDIPSKIYGMPYTDKVIIKPLEKDLFEFVFIEAEAQSYDYIKRIHKDQLTLEISNLLNISGNAEVNGYELMQF